MEREAFDGPYREYSNRAGAGFYANFFSITSVQQQQPAWTVQLSYRLFISAPWMEINSACILFCIHFIDFISQPSGASVKTNKSLLLADES